MSIHSTPSLALYRPQAPANPPHPVSIPGQIDIAATIKAMGLERFAVLLINAAHMPQLSVVTDEQKRLMMGEMEYLREFLLSCKPADPTFIGSKKCFMHPCDTSSKYQITKFFKGLHETIKAVKKIRGGLELSHIGEGQRIVSHFVKVQKDAKGKERITADLDYVMDLRKVTESHWGKICNDPASYGIGEIYGERYHMLMRAVNAGQLVVEEALSPEYLEAEWSENEATKERRIAGRVGLARAYQASAAAYQQVYSGINQPVRQAPTPTSQIVPNPYYGIGGNYSAVAFRQPGGLITT